MFILDKSPFQVLCSRRKSYKRAFR